MKALYEVLNNLPQKFVLSIKLSFMKAIGLILVFLEISSFAFGQNLNTREQDVIFRKHLVRAFSLKDPRNVEIFGENARNFTKCC
jgi:hypothetical protein